MLATVAFLTAGCLIDGLIILVLAYLTDGRRTARELYPPRATRSLRSLH